MVERSCFSLSCVNWPLGALLISPFMLGCSDVPWESTARTHQSIVTNPKLSDEVSVETPVAVLQMVPPQVSVAAGKDSYLLVWGVQQDGAASGSDIYGARVGFDGKLLDPMAFTISTAKGDQSLPEVAYNGTEWLVVWNDLRKGSDADIYAARVDLTGKVLDPKGIAIGTSSGNETLSDVASDGTRFFVLSKLNGLVGTFVNADGIVDPTPVAVAVATTTTIGTGRLSYNGTHFLALYTEYSNTVDSVRSVRVTPSGTRDALATEIVSSSGITITDCSVASGGGQWLVAYSITSSASGGVSGSVYTVPVAADGSRVTTQQSAGSYTIPKNLEMGYHGNLFTLTLTSSPDSLGISTTGSSVVLQFSAGGVLQNNKTLFSASTWASYDMALGYDGTNFLLAHVNRAGTVSGNTGEYFVRAARMAPDLTMVDTAPISVGFMGNKQRVPDVAFNGTNYLVAWEDRRAGLNNYDIRASLVTPTGNVVTPNGLAVSSALYRQSYPAVASNGTDFLVAWWDLRAQLSSGQSDLMFTAVTATGTVVHPTGFQVTTGSAISRPTMASLGGKYLVIAAPWMEGYIVDPSPTPIVTATTPTALAVNGGYPTVATNGTNYLVAYAAKSDIYGVFVNAAGTRTTTENGIIISAIANTTESSVVAASNGSEYLAIWREGDTKIRGTRIASDGTVRDNLGFDLYTSPPGISEMQLVWDGSSYVATWLEPTTTGLEQGVRALRIDVSGATPVVSAPISVSSTIEAENFPRIAVGNTTASNKQSFIVYDRYDASADALVGRVKGRFLSDNTIVVPSSGAGGASGVGGASGSVGSGGMGPVGGGTSKGTGGTGLVGSVGTGGSGVGTTSSSASVGGTTGVGSSVTTVGGTISTSGSGDKAGGAAIEPGGVGGVSNAKGGASSTTKVGSSSSAGSDDKAACVPGDQKACACPGGAEDGVQVCNDSGTGYEECLCVASTAKSSGDDGCGCRVASQRSASGRGLWLVGLAMATLLRRRRARSHGDVN